MLEKDLKKFIGEKVVVLLTNDKYYQGTFSYCSKYERPKYRLEGYYYINNIGVKKELIKAIGMIKEDSNK